MKDLVYVAEHRASKGYTSSMACRPTWSFPFPTSCSLRKLNSHVCEMWEIREGCLHPVSHQVLTIPCSKYFSNLALTLHLGTDISSGLLALSGYFQKLLLSLPLGSLSSILPSMSLLEMSLCVLFPCSKNIEHCRPQINKVLSIALEGLHGLVT